MTDTEAAPVPAVPDALEQGLRSGARGFSVVTTDEQRAIAGLEAVAARLQWPLHTWSAASGVDADGHPRVIEELLADLHSHRTDAIWILCDGAASLGSPAARRALRELAQRSHGPAVIVLGPDCDAQDKVTAAAPELVTVEVPPPTADELAAHLRWIAAQSGGDGADLAAAADVVATAALGLDLDAFERMVAAALVSGGPDPTHVAEAIRRQKPTVLLRTAALEPVSPRPAEELGGVHRLKQWLLRRSRALTAAARRVAIPHPRGVLLLGVQGCGKSLTARVCADVLGMPLLRLDPGRLFGPTVGQSEANLRRTTATVERIAPCVLWVDELDKGFAGADGSQSDAGTAARVLGGLLTWLQEHQAPVFVVATANRIDTLPPELVRRGRLDEVFFIDLPDAEARAEIAKIHLLVAPARRLGQAPPLGGSWPAFAEAAAAAEGFSGAELEAAIVEARLAAFAQDRPPTPQDLQDALQDIVPLSRTRHESIAALRRWASDRARGA